MLWEYGQSGPGVYNGEGAILKEADDGPAKPLSQLAIPNTETFTGNPPYLILPYSSAGRRSTRAVGSRLQGSESASACSVR